jgi:two-component system, NarL family, sensor histidine kinase DegS
MAEEGAELADRLADQRSAVQRELEEIELLMRQARTEADRHATRRESTAERLQALMDEHGVPQPVREAHEQLMLQHQRSGLMSAQLEVLEGKQRVLERLMATLEDVGATLGGMARDETPAVPGNGAERPAAGPAGGAQSRTVLAAQEEMRRAIARQMHDGPAQSIANIALQAEVVQRLMARQPDAAEREIGELRQMVQHALEATKSFIFDVRPMVLDDLGLVPTLRRAVSQRQRASGVAVRFESVGADRRLEPEVETQLFRILDDALAGLLGRRPVEVVLRLNWTDEELSLAMRSRPPSGAAEVSIDLTSAQPSVPSALADMIRDQDADDAAREDVRRQAYGLASELLDDLEQRARAVGIQLLAIDGGLRLEGLVKHANGTR